MSSAVSSLPGMIRLVDGVARDFGDFELLAKLGHGGMADVFLAARKAKRSELLVVKRLKADYVDDGEHRALFEDEARVAPLLRHPNIVRTWDSGEAAGFPYMAMEYLEGQALDRLVLVLQSLGPRAAVHVAAEVLDGLHYVHELCSADGRPLEIVHRDVSPHNVFLTYEGRVTLVDFGIAKSKTRARQTATGVVRGKIGYMAPEQALCDEVDRRADVFAVAVVLWELLTGEKLWGEASDVQILKRMTFGEIPSIGDHMSGLPPALVEVVTKALAPKPEDRYSTARQFRDALGAVFDTPFRRVELGRAVADYAKDQRRAMRAAIDGHLARAFGTLDAVESLANGEAADQGRGRLEPGAPPASTPSEPVVETSSASSTSLAVQVAGAPAPEAAGLELERDRPDAASPTPMALELGGDAGSRHRGRSGVLWLALGATAAVAGAGWVLFAALSGSSSASGQSESTGQSGATSAIVSVDARPSVSGRADPSDQVEVRIEVAPDGAVATLDGMRIESPFSARFPRDRAARSLRVEAPGHVGQTTLVVFDRDQRLSVALVPEPLTVPTGSASASPAGSGPRVARPRPTSAPTVATSPPLVDDRDPWAPKPR